MKIKTREFINKVLSKIGYRLERTKEGRPNPIHLWDEDAPFNELFDGILAVTIVDKKRCFMLYQFAIHLSSVPGEIAEVGVYRGGTARLLAKALEPSGKSIHLFDTFSGMPTVDKARDLHSAGDFNDTSLEAVKAFLHGCINVHFHSGIFPQTAQPVKDLTFCFVHIDVDIYKSVIDCCEFFYPRMQGGGIMVFDDYGFVSCPGAKLAVDEFFSDKAESPCYLATGQCFVIRVSRPEYCKEL